MQNSLWKNAACAATFCIANACLATTLTNQQRSDAALKTVANNSACKTLTPFYWEIGDGKGALSSGTGGDNSTTAPNSATQMSVASASKFPFAAYVLQRYTLADIENAGYLPYFNHTSGYHAMGIWACADPGQDVVGVCFNSNSNSTGNINNTRTTADIGKFYYDSGHQQAYVDNTLKKSGSLDLSLYTRAALAMETKSQLGQELLLTFATPVAAGGFSMSANDFAIILRKIINGSLRMKSYLGAKPICAWTNMPGCDAAFSPVNQNKPGPVNNISNEKWHYSIGHWVEDDPVVGDGAFSSFGLWGFYPWIDKTKSYYGIIARYDTNIYVDDATTEPFIESMHCGRLVRKAWFTGIAQ